MRLLLDIYVNKNKQSLIADCYIDENNVVWMREEDLLALEIKFQNQLSREINGKIYLSLSDFPAIRYELDSAELALYITVPTQYFEETKIGLTGPNPEKIRPEQPGLYLNYDFSVQRTNLPNQANAAVLSELGYFNPYGMGSCNFFVQGGENTPTQWVRLETIWTIDQPESISSWYIGDSISGNNIWSGAVRFAGLQRATNFNTQPYLVTFPLPAFSGQAIVPTTLSVFINDALNVTEEIKNGPFTIYDIPVVTGAGSVKVLTNDVLGRQRETVIPYYSSQQFLKPGLVDYSYEVGVIRNDYGIASFDYSQLMGVGTYSKGIQEDWTAGWHIELLADQQTIGVASEYLWYDYFVISTGLAGSHGTLGEGGLLLLGLQRQTQTYSYGFQVIPCTEYFTELGLVENQPSPSLQMQTWATLSTPQFGTFSASYTVVNNRIPDIEAYDTQAIQILPNVKLLTLNYNHSLLKNMYFILGSLIDFNQKQNNIYFLSIVWGFKQDYSLSATSSFQSGDDQQTILLNKNIPWGNGYGYNLSYSQGDPQQMEGSYTYQNNYGTYSATVAKIGGETNYLGEITGGIVRFGGHTILSRKLYDSFALIEVPGYEDICIYNRNTCVGTTNKSGLLLVPNLLPYQKNSVSIDARDFPLSAAISLFDLEGLPYYRSGILMVFPVKQVINCSFRLRTIDDHPVPLGAKVTLDNQQEYFYVMNEGSVFVTSESEGTLKGKVEWENKQCEFILRDLVNHATIIDRGEVWCY